MKIHRIDHVGVMVNDLTAATQFFVDIGLEVQGEWESEGEWMDQVVGLNGVKASCVGLGIPGGQAWLELIQYHSPVDEQAIQLPLANTQGIRHIAIAVEGVEVIVARLKEKGVEFFGEIQNYQDTYKLCYCRGPEGMILELAERIVRP